MYDKEAAQQAYEVLVHAESFAVMLAEWFDGLADFASVQMKVGPVVTYDRGSVTIAVQHDDDEGTEIVALDVLRERLAEIKALLDDSRDEA
ncbi:MAG: hypothetical protein M3N47_08225 [Chloroflexota bacterium]|nr:hypothetical protein [Chloroflexota bacterium]